MFVLQCLIIFLADYHNKQKPVIGTILPQNRGLPNFISGSKVTQGNKNLKLMVMQRLGDSF